jgi:hypothetical protein
MEFIDLYDFLSLSPESTQQVIKSRIYEMYKTWHPDVCKAPNANEMTRTITVARDTLLDSKNRELYDRIRTEHYHSKKTSNSNTSNSKDEWSKFSQEAYDRAEASTQLTLESLLVGLSLIAIVAVASAAELTMTAAAYTLAGSKHYRDERNKPSKGKLIWCGIAGWACVICLVVPGVSIITYFCFKWAFFPGPDYKFIGLANVLTGMWYVFLIIFLIAAFIGVGVLITAH